MPGTCTIKISVKLLRYVFSSVTLKPVYHHNLILFTSVTQSCPTLCSLMDWSTPGFSVHHQLPTLLKLMCIESVMPNNHLNLCHPLLFLPSIFPSIRVFTSGSVLRIMWPKYWSFSFSISPSNEYSGLISFRMDWLNLLAVQETFKSPLVFSNTTVQKHLFFGTQLSLILLNTFNGRCGS